jgi:hypothetical protein
VEHDLRGLWVEQLREAADLLTDSLLGHLAYKEREMVKHLARPGFY